MDREGMRGRTRLFLGETNSANSFYTDAEINSAINDAQISVARDTEELLTWIELTTADNDDRYTLSTDFLKLKYVTIEVSTSDIRELRMLTVREYQEYTRGSSTTQGTPEVYKMERGAVAVDSEYPAELWLYPIPDTNGGINYTVKVYFYQMPTELTADADVSELPPYCHLAVCYLASANVMMKGADLSKSDRMRQVYFEELSRLKQFYAEPNRVSPARMRDEMGYTRSEIL